MLFSLLTFTTDGAKAVVDKTAGTLAKIGAVEPNYTIGHYIHHCSKKQNACFTLKMSHEAVKINSLILLNFDLWDMSLLFYVMKWETQNTSLLHTKVQ